MVSNIRLLEIHNVTVMVIYMKERDIIKSIIDFSFLIKSQLQSEETAMLRSILSIMIMECEDLVAELDEPALPDWPRAANPKSG